LAIIRSSGEIYVFEARYLGTHVMTNITPRTLPKGIEGAKGTIANSTSRICCGGNNSYILVGFFCPSKERPKGGAEEFSSYSEAFLDEQHEYSARSCKIVSRDTRWRKSFLLLSSVDVSTSIDELFRMRYICRKNLRSQDPRFWCMLWRQRTSLQHWRG